MHSHTPTPTKSTPMQPDTFLEYCNTLQLTPAQFRAQVITILNTAIAQRKKIINRGRSRLFITEDIASVFAMFDAYKNTWTPAGLAGFILNKADLIRMIIPGSNPLLAQRFNEMLSIAHEIQ